MQVYVIGSTTKLGKWKVQDGLKLGYAGGSIWEADCVFPRADFPLKYPFNFVSFQIYISLSLSLVSLTVVLHINTVNMEKQENFLWKLDPTETSQLIPLVFNWGTSLFQMACCE